MMVKLWCERKSGLNIEEFGKDGLFTFLEKINYLIVDYDDDSIINKDFYKNIIKLTNINFLIIAWYFNNMSNK